jgi:hypothetical protein
MISAAEVYPKKKTKKKNQENITKQNETIN